MRIAVANDHAGYPLKLAVVQHLEAAGHDVVDLGSHSTEPIDYPPICAACARRVVTGDVEVGVVIGGSGQGEALAANKVPAPGPRSATTSTPPGSPAATTTPTCSRSAPKLAEALALDIVDVFLVTAFDGGRHQQRIEEITAIEDEEAARS